MKALEVLILFGFACISPVRSNPSSEKINTIKYEIPEELIQILDPAVTDKNIILSIITLTLKKWDDDVAAFNETLQKKKVLVETNQFSVEETLNKENEKNTKELLEESTRISSKKSILFQNLKKGFSVLDALDFFMQHRYFVEINNERYSLEHSSKTIDEVRKSFEPKMTATFDVLIKRTIVTAFYGGHEDTGKAVLKNRILDIFKAMIKIYPYIYGTTDDNKPDRQENLNSLYNELLSYTQIILFHLKKNNLFDKPQGDYLKLLLQEFEKIYSENIEPTIENVDENPTTKNEENKQKNTESSKIII